MLEASFFCLLWISLPCVGHLQSMSFDEAQLSIKLSFSQSSEGSITASQADTSAASEDSAPDQPATEDGDSGKETALSYAVSSLQHLAKLVALLLPWHLAAESM